MLIFKMIFTPLLAMSVLTAPLSAQDQPISLSGDVKHEKTTVDAAGEAKTELVEPNTIVPGDRLIFGTDYTNSSDEQVENFVVTNPLPEAVRLAPDADAALTVSVDGGQTFGALSQLSVRAEDGSTRPAEHADVTHVRWTLASVAPGESGRLEYPAIIR
ncbi:hypothetical protein [Qipengyuania qiaonensis]|uniref:DUF11 domain-containing protein n=1 Tax=Qipengyuania qiaonensis TaxID=2867240 RepID=A0ABS7J6R9_9SPHN|nr:hypothetical protein [Qipengyuania qiaonensis]MBX7483007.1 hypothetical protein [Qipengyuania qiaonensis]